MDGWVKLGTKLDTKRFEAKIKEVETNMEEIEHKIKQANMGLNPIQYDIGLKPQNLLKPGMCV